MVIGFILGVVRFFIALAIYVVVMKVGDVLVSWLATLHFIPRTIVLSLAGYCFWKLLAWAFPREARASRTMAGWIFGVVKFLALLLLLQVVFVAGSDLIQWLSTFEVTPRPGG